MSIYTYTYEQTLKTQLEACHNFLIEQSKNQEIGERTGQLIERAEREKEK